MYNLKDRDAHIFSLTLLNDSYQVHVWEHFFLFPVEIILIGIKNMGFSLVCVEKKVLIKNMFNVWKQL